MQRLIMVLGLCCLALSLGQCKKKVKDSGGANKLWKDATPEPIYDSSSEWIKQTQKYAIDHLTVMTATGTTLENAYIIFQDGKISELGTGEIPAQLAQDALRIDGKGRYLTPGIIDTHSHIGVYPLPGVKAHQDGNEATDPVTPDVWSEHSFWPQDPSLWRALSAGVTTIQVLPGSANLVGGRAVTLHTKPAPTMAGMRFPGAPQGLKMACGENPKRSYGEKSGPSTRMGNVAGYRRAFQEALEYQKEWAEYQDRGPTSDRKMPKRDHKLDTLVKAMQGEILVHVHCYRSDEMALMLDLAKTYGFKIRSFHHALEAYKIKERLAAEQVSISTWADWWGFKMEALDGIPQNAPFLAAVGGKPIMHSDSEDEIRYLPVEAHKARQSAAAFGTKFTDEEVLQWVTKNPAWALGIDDKVGTIEKGKLADLVLWDRHPFSIYSKAEKVFISGELVFDRSQGLVPRSDLELGIRNYGLADRGSQTEPLPGKGVPSLADPLPPLPAASKDERFLLENVRLETGKGTSFEKASVLVEQGIIKAINPSVGGLPPDLTRIDAGGRILTPGFIETQSLLGTVIVELEEEGQDKGLGEGFHPAYRVADGFDPYSFRMAITRREGISSAIAKPTEGGVAGQGLAFDLAMRPDSLDTPVPPIMFAQVLGDKTRGRFWLELRQAFDDARLYKAQGGKTNMISHQLSLSPLHLEALWEVLQGKVPLVLGVHRQADIEAAIRLKRELQNQKFPIQLILSGAGESWLVSKELVAADIPVLITPSKQLPSKLDQLKVRDDLATVLAEAGVNFAISTDDIRATRLRQEAGRAVLFGLSYADAIAAISARPAAIFGFKDRGSIEVGKRADLALWSGDPLEPASQLERLWIRGRAQDLNSRQLELAKAYAPLAKVGGT